MLKLLAIPFLLLTTAQADPVSNIKYSLLREQGKPAASTTMKASTQSIEETGMISFETDGYGDHPIEWVDQMWVSPTLTQAMFIKFDLKPNDESIIGKMIPLQNAYLFHGRQDNGTYFAAYFNGFDEKSAKEYFQKIVHAKDRTAWNGFKNMFTLPLAHAEQTTACGTKVTGVIKGLYTVVKENKWSCVKSFIKNAFGGIVIAAANTILGVMDGSIWNKIGTNWQYITTVFAAINKTTGSLKDLEFLPEKIRAEFICESLGKGASAASGSLGAKLTGQALANAVAKFVKQVSYELFNSVKYKKIINDNKIKQQAYCTKPSTNQKGKTALSGASAAGSAGITTNQSSKSAVPGK